MSEIRCTPTWRRLTRWMHAPRVTPNSPVDSAMCASPSAMRWPALVAAALLALLSATVPAQAQPAPPPNAPTIYGFDVQPVPKPAPGNELAFTLYGSPGGVAGVHIDGATGNTLLAETDPGIYEGTYTIRKRDRITGASTTTANLRVGDRVASMILDEPLIGKSGPRQRATPPPLAGAPRIDRFEVQPLARLEPGEELLLTLTGSPGGQASATIAGMRGKVVLSEVRSGVYEGSYTIANRDRIATDAKVTGTLRSNNHEASARLGHGLLAASGAPAQPAQARRCTGCGVVETIHEVEVKGEGSYLGKIAGGVAGALIGSQIGSGRGTTVAEIAGAAGGVFAGNEIEKRVKTRKHYEVLVRLDNGGTTTVPFEAPPGFAIGARVKVENGSLSALR